MTAIKGKLPWVAALFAAGFLLVGTVPAQSLDDDCSVGNPPPCDETVSSLGNYTIQPDCRFMAMFVTCPAVCPCGPGCCGGYDTINNQYTSPNLSDPATVIGRSASHTDGSAADSGGTNVGALGTLISDGNLTVRPAGVEGPPGSREVHTEIVSLTMTDTGPCGSSAQVLAGAPAHGLQMSPGEVESQDGTGNPANDFPADSYFNMYVEVDIPMCGLFPGATVFNRDPLLVKAVLWGFPPSVVYIHGETPAVEVYFRNNNPPLWNAGDRLGWLTLAGHGVNVGEYDLCEAVDAAPPLQPDLGGTGACCWPDQPGHPCTDGMTYNACCTDPLGAGVYHGDGSQCGTVEACCYDDGSCDTLAEICCADRGGWRSHYPNCLGDLDPVDGVDDACENVIPAVSSWGLIAMGLLILAAGAIVLRRVRRATA